MSETVVLPALGESVTEGTVTRWLKQVGEHVDVDEPLVEVSTDKVDTEVPSPVAGTVQQILVKEDETVDVGAALAVIGSGTPAAALSPAEPADAPVVEHVAETAPPAPTPAAQPVAVAHAPQSLQPAPVVQAPAAAVQVPVAVVQAAAAGHVNAAAPLTYVTPIVRKLAAEKGVDLTTIVGTGVGGRIRREDIVAASEQRDAARLVAESTPPTGAASTAAVPFAKPEPSPLRGTTVPMSRLRKVLAKSMVHSLQTAAQLTTVVEIDVTGIARLRAAYKTAFEKATGGKLSFMAFFAYAAVEALPAYPMINASIDDESINYHGTENLSIAVDTERGLYAPVIKDAGTLSIAELVSSIADLASRARSSSLTPDDLTGGTFTLTNTGSRGALFDTPVVALPQAAILGTGIIVKKPVVISADGQDSIAIRSMVHFALSYDHRLVDGADAARYLSDLKRRLEGADFVSALGI